MVARVSQLLCRLEVSLTRACCVRVVVQPQRRGFAHPKLIVLGLLPATGL